MISRRAKVAAIAALANILITGYYALSDSNNLEPLLCMDFPASVLIIAIAWNVKSIVGVWSICFLVGGAYWWMIAYVVYSVLQRIVRCANRSDDR